jgi:hypothetical protein
MVVIVVVGVVIIGALAPEDPPPTCGADVTLCPKPPGGGDDESTGSTPGPTSGPGTGTAAFLPSGRYTSTDFGFAVPFDATRWKIKAQNGSAVLLFPVKDIGIWASIEAASASDQSVAGMIEATLDALRQQYPGLELDNDPYNAILGAEIGYVNAEGASYKGTGTGSDGLPDTPAGFAILGATDGRIVVVFTFEVDDPEELLFGDTRQYGYRARGDTLLGDFLWVAP